MALADKARELLQVRGISACGLQKNGDFFRRRPAKKVTNQTEHTIGISMTALVYAIP